MRQILAVLVLMLTGCQILAGNDDSDNASTINVMPIVIDWDRDETAVVFRADITGGTNADRIFMRSEVPLCTIYGDGRVVWTTESDEGMQVLFDILPDEFIRTFIENLTVFRKIYAYNLIPDGPDPEETQPVELPTLQPITEGAQPVVEQLELTVNGVRHLVDSRSGWPADYFTDVLGDCTQLSKTPIAFEPDGGWISAEVREYDPDVPVITWDAEGSGLDLVQVAESGEPKWVAERVLLVLWVLAQQPPANLQFQQDDVTLHLAVEVPGVTRSSPPAP